MGIQIVSKTWRAPLQLIDSWLPSAAPRRFFCRPMAPLMQRFARAGWLGQPTNKSPCATTSQVLGASITPSTVPTAPARVLRPTRLTRGNGRLVISGRIADVCAELDRLAAQEQRNATA